MTDRAYIRPTPEHSLKVIKDFCHAVSLVRTLTGDAGLALDLSQALTGPLWIHGGQGAMDWAHHQVVDEAVGTPRELLAQVRTIVRGYLATMPELPPEGARVGQGAWAWPDDLPHHRADVERVLRKISRKVHQNEVNGFDPRTAIQGF